MATTTDQNVAEAIARHLEGRRIGLSAERAKLVRAADRITEIDAELAIVETELARVQSRRPTPAQIQSR